MRCSPIYALVLQRYIDVEVALAKAEARVGVIPSDGAAEVIAPRESTIERGSISITCVEETDIVGYPILPLVHQLVAACVAKRAATSIGARRHRTSWIQRSSQQVRDALDIIDS